ncbi:MAG TPA: dihydrofolate reductase family protein [Lapillicoccus sp.]|jgi:dihydrofolate reductase|nr:dihydrofolate reductase family protein [Lapillicoccus sp.]
MRNVVVVENLSLDGVMQAPGRPDEDERGGFPYGGWASDILSRDPEAVQAALGDTGGSAEMLFGRRTYLDLVGHWLSTPEPNPFTEILRKTTKYVASRTLTDPLPHPNSVRLDGDAVEAVRALKAEGEHDLIVLGSGDLVRQLAGAGLVDAYQLTVLPVVLGAGTRLFGDTHTELEPVKTQAFPSGIFLGRFRVV